MDCPNCGTYNPEDRTTCWRCNTELPKPKPQKRRDPRRNAQLFLWVALAFFMLMTALQFCGFFQTPSEQAAPGGVLYLPLPLWSLF